jgi:hypothetical protein
MSKVGLGNQEQAKMMLHFPGISLMEEQRIVDKQCFQHFSTTFCR